MRFHRPITVVLPAAFLFIVTAQSAMAAGAPASAPSPGAEVEDRQTIEVFGRRRDSVITPELLQRLGGVEGAREWIGMMVDNLRLSFPLRQKLARFDTPRQREELNQLFVNTMLGKPLGVERSTVEAVERLQLTEEEFNMITESVMETCEDSNLSYRDCNRILVSIQPVGLYARGF